MWGDVRLGALCAGLEQFHLEAYLAVTRYAVTSRTVLVIKSVTSLPIAFFFYEITVRYQSNCLVTVSANDVKMLQCYWKSTLISINIFVAHTNASISCWVSPCSCSSTIQLFQWAWKSIRRYCRYRTWYKFMLVKAIRSLLLLKINLNSQAYWCYQYFKCMQAFIRTVDLIFLGERGVKELGKSGGMLPGNSF